MSRRMEVNLVDKSKEKRIGMNIVNQFFDYLIENGVPISVEFRQKHNDALDDFVNRLVEPRLEEAGITSDLEQMFELGREWGHDIRLYKILNCEQTRLDILSKYQNKYHA